MTQFQKLALLIGALILVAVIGLLAVTALRQPMQTAAVTTMQTATEALPAWVGETQTAVAAAAQTRAYEGYQTTVKLVEQTRQAATPRS